MGREGTFAKRLLIGFLDTLIIVCSFILAYLLRFDFRWSFIPEVYREDQVAVITVCVVVSLLVYQLFGMYRFVWRYFNTYDAIKSVVGASLVFVLTSVIYLVSPLQVPLSVQIMAFVFILLLTVVMRASYRIFNIITSPYSKSSRQFKRVLIVGAGDAGRMLLKEIQQSNHIQLQVVGFIDDNRALWGKEINSVPILGGRSSILFEAERLQVDSIFVALPSASVDQRREILDLCKLTGCELKTLPGIYQIISGEVSVSKLRDVEIEDLLGREPVRIDLDTINLFLRGKVVIVTGGGGSIGSELCRQIVQYDPKQLIILDVYENNAYAVQMELQHKYPDLNLLVLISSVRDEERIDDVFRTWKPDIVFHAVAHKHVPLMETVPNEAVKNNVFGTLNVCRAADKYQAERFVLISTDKAVNPTNVMGATKRICEMIVQYFSERSKTKSVAVRFGNVLGSNGSVIPLFKRQIKAGGPVTVTDKRIIRYFMTIPEAVSLVLEAGGTAKNGEIYVLDMGDPVKIDDLARNLIRLSGLRPDVDIEIVYSGLRPGEKLFEEPLMDEEFLRDTENARIHIGNALKFDHAVFEPQIAELKRRSRANDPAIRDLIREIVPTYHEQREAAVEQA